MAQVLSLVPAHDSKVSTELHSFAAPDDHLLFVLVNASTQFVENCQSICAFATACLCTFAILVSRASGVIGQSAQKSQARHSLAVTECGRLPIKGLSLIEVSGYPIPVSVEEGQVRHRFTVSGCDSFAKPVRCLREIRSGRCPRRKRQAGCFSGW